MTNMYNFVQFLLKVNTVMLCIVCDVRIATPLRIRLEPNAKQTPNTKPY